MNDRIDSASDDAALSAHAKAAFDRSVDRLDAATLSRLNQGRHRALDHARGRRSGVAVLQRWAPVTGLAAAAVVAVAVWTTNDQPVPSSAPTAATDLEIILEFDEFEMLEDLEFYSWIDLEEQPDRV